MSQCIICNTYFGDEYAMLKIGTEEYALCESCHYKMTDGRLCSIHACERCSMLEGRIRFRDIYREFVLCKSCTMDAIVKKWFILLDAGVLNV